MNYVFYSIGAANRLTSFFARAAPDSVQFFSLSARCKRGESRRTRFEILQGLVRQLNGIDFASILVVLYPCLPACALLNVFRERVRIFLLYIFLLLHIYNQTLFSWFYLLHKYVEKSRKTKNLRNNSAWEQSETETHESF